MEVHSDWYDKISREINLHKDTLNKKDYKKYKLDLLLRVAKRIDSFSPECGDCQIFQQDITQLTQDLGYLTQWSKEQRKSHSKTISNIIRHLKKNHKLVTEGYYMGIWISIGTAIGVAIGAGSDNVGVGIPIGIAIGVGIGAYLHKKAKKEGKVI